LGVFPAQDFLHGDGNRRPGLSWEEINMNALRFFLAAALSFAALAAVPAHGAARTFVASTGNDANLCSLVAPCRSFAAAMAVTDPNGEVLVLDSAGYGTFTITKSVSVIAPEGVYAGISVPVGQSGITVNGPSIKVTLRGLTVNGQGGNDGIRIVNAGNVFIEKVTIANTGASGADAGIHVAGTATGARVFITDTTVRGTAGHGVRIDANAVVVVDRGRIEGNGSNGILGQSPGARLTVNDSLIARNASTGVQVVASAAGLWDLTVARCSIEGNSLGVDVSGGTGGFYVVAVSDNVLRANFTGVNVFAGTGETAIAVVSHNRIVGNDSAGITCDGSGTTTLVAERNEVLANGIGLPLGGVGVRQFGTCTLKSLVNNMLENNIITDVSGVITPALPR
jgi:parallel beta helix pectate lyase-like protein